MSAFAWPVVWSVGALLVGVVAVLGYGSMGVSSALTRGRSYTGKGSGATRLPTLSDLPKNPRSVRVALLSRHRSSRCRLMTEGLGYRLLPCRPLAGTMTPSVSGGLITAG